LAEQNLLQAINDGLLPGAAGGGATFSQGRAPSGRVDGAAGSGFDEHAITP
jgi:hypothetical protein